jgi:peptidyl-prolyl cis-trans isomerase C
MGLFDFFQGGKKKSASASHILVKGKEGVQFLNELKVKLKSSKNVPQAFADAAAQYSSCPSSKRGGALGTFQQGQMVFILSIVSNHNLLLFSLFFSWQVPAFDKVVFNEEIGVIHGPINTPFGAHLILIDERSE